MILKLHVAISVVPNSNSYSLTKLWGYVPLVICNDCYPRQERWGVRGGAIIEIVWITCGMGKKNIWNCCCQLVLMRHLRGLMFGNGYWCRCVYAKAFFCWAFCCTVWRLCVDTGIKWEQKKQVTWRQWMILQMQQTIQSKLARNLTNPKQASMPNLLLVTC